MVLGIQLVEVGRDGQTYSLVRSFRGTSEGLATSETGGWGAYKWPNLGVLGQRISYTVS